MTSADCSALRFEVNPRNGGGGGFLARGSPQDRSQWLEIDIGRTSLPQGLRPQPDRRKRSPADVSLTSRGYPVRPVVPSPRINRKATVV
jgi:hypothetical protein